MKTEIKRLRLIVPRWWNPLFWLAVVLAPAAGLVVGMLVGGMSGYEKGLEYARGKMHEINRTLP